METIIYTLATLAPAACIMFIVYIVVECCDRAADGEARGKRLPYELNKLNYGRWDVGVGSDGCKLCLEVNGRCYDRCGYWSK